MNYETLTIKIGQTITCLYKFILACIVTFINKQALVMAYARILCLLSFAYFVSVVVSTVPSNNTFKYVNSGDYGEYRTEYDAWYRFLPLATGPFQLCFYKTTTNTYTLALRMLMTGQTSNGIWVWEANRGKPVGEKAVFALLQNGNLVLAEANGRVVWQTNTANKGVVGFEILPNGNMVLYDAKRNYLWQSFDHPTDTLLVDQYLKLGGTTKMVSRASAALNADGPFSLVMEPIGLAMYYTTPLDSQRYQYFSSSKWFTVQKGPLKQVTLSTSPKRDNASSYEVSLNYEAANPAAGDFVLFRSKNNPIYSYLRLEMDGNLKLYIFDNKVGGWGAWKTGFTLFSKDSQWASECELPSRCGSFGLCQDNKCVACPIGNTKSPTGSLPAWNGNCTTQPLKSCASKDFYYYQLVGVDHFSSQYTQGEGPTTQAACSSKCTNNCKCQGFFYHKDSQRCWAVNDLKTLVSVKNNAHVLSVKTPK